MKFNYGGFGANTGNFQSIVKIADEVGLEGKNISHAEYYRLKASGGGKTPEEISKFEAYEKTLSLIESPLKSRALNTLGLSKRAEDVIKKIVQKQNPDAIGEQYNMHFMKRYDANNGIHGYSDQNDFAYLDLDGIGNGEVNLNGGDDIVVASSTFNDFTGWPSSFDKIDGGDGYDVINLQTPASQWPSNFIFQKQKDGSYIIAFRSPNGQKADVGQVSVKNFEDIKIQGKSLQEFKEKIEADLSKKEEDLQKAKEIVSSGNYLKESPKNWNDPKNRDANGTPLPVINDTAAYIAQREKALNQAKKQSAETLKNIDEFLSQNPEPKNGYYDFTKEENRHFHNLDGGRVGSYFETSSFDPDKSHHTYDVRNIYEQKKLPAEQGQIFERKTWEQVDSSVLPNFKNQREYYEWRRSGEGENFIENWFNVRRNIG